MSDGTSRSRRPPLPLGFWLALIGTALIGIGANLAWISIGGLGMGGQSLFVSAVAPIDPALIYAAAGTSVLGLVVYAVTRRRWPMLICGGSAIAAGTIFALAMAELVDDIGDVGEGGYVLGSGVMLLLIGAFVSPEQTFGSEFGGGA